MSKYLPTNHPNPPTYSLSFGLQPHLNLVGLHFSLIYFFILACSWAKGHGVSDGNCPSCQREKAMDKSPAHCRATYRQASIQLTFTPSDNLDSPINLICVFLDCESKLPNPERTHAITGRTCKLHIEGLGIEPTTFQLWGGNAIYCNTLSPLHFSFPFILRKCASNALNFPTGRAIKEILNFSLFSKQFTRFAQPWWA